MVAARRVAAEASAERQTLLPALLGLIRRLSRLLFAYLTELLTSHARGEPLPLLT